MMAVIQRNLEQPGAVRLALHGMGTWVPIIEVPGEKDLPGIRRLAKEADRLGHLAGGVASWGSVGIEAFLNFSLVQCGLHSVFVGLGEDVGFKLRVSSVHRADCRGR